MLIIGYFISGRADIAQCRMATLPIVEGFGVKENVRARLRSGFVDPMMHPFHFQVAKETLGWAIIRLCSPETDGSLTDLDRAHPYTGCLGQNGGSGRQLPCGLEWPCAAYPELVGWSSVPTWLSPQCGAGTIPKRRPDTATLPVWECR